jgi:uncharacterized membrane protein YdjX (TVP38/TMEM64 family)
VLILVPVVVYNIYWTDVSALVNSVTQFLIWVDSLGYIAPIVVFAIHCVSIAVCFPLTILLEWGCGFLFGLVGGSCLIILSKSFGALLCFILGTTKMIQISDIS